MGKTYRNDPELNHFTPARARRPRRGTLREQASLERARAQWSDNLRRLDEMLEAAGLLQDVAKGETR